LLIDKYRPFGQGRRFLWERAEVAEEAEKRLAGVAAVAATHKVIGIQKETITLPK
jgi:hypothetical protein